MLSKDRWSLRIGGLQGQVVSKDRWSPRIGGLQGKVVFIQRCFSVVVFTQEVVQ